MAVGIAPMAIFYIFACSNLQPKAKGRDKVGVIGEMGAIGFRSNRFYYRAHGTYYSHFCISRPSSPMGSEVFSSKYTPFRFFILIFVLCMRIMRERAQKPHPNEDN